MAYISLYRKYRPSTFSEVIGQDVIVKILKNSIINNKISHAYIFSGPRGTGKTSIAKIFAKAVNCINTKDGDLCGKCSNCLRSFDEEIDIIEIDAASNNGVDEIREIRNNVKLLPSNLKYKVYIIDEVHMLSTSAFNALLKTLEEPPAHVIFILATTEIHKIPLTVLSRCQKFDFKKISNENIKLRIHEILKKEKYSVTDDVVDLIGELSDGGLRDAINLLDQIISMGEKEITQTNVYNLIGSVSDDELLQFVDNMLLGKTEEVLKNIDFFFENGKNIANIINRVQKIIKDILIFNGTTNYFNKEYEKILLKYSKINIDLIIKLSDELLKLNYDIKKNDNLKNIVEIYFLRMVLMFNKEETIIKNETTEDTKSDIIIEENDSIDKKIRINNCLSNANKEYKSNFLKGYKEINEYLTNKYYNSIANLLVKGTPEVVSDEYVIISFKNNFEIVLFEKNFEKIEKFIKKIYNNHYKLVAVSNIEWNQIKEEYIKNKSSGIKYNYVKEELKTTTKNKKGTLEDNVLNIFGEDYIDEE